MKRINVKLLAILTATMLFFGIGGVGLYQFQMKRSTQTFLDQADEYKAQGDLANARTSLYRYLQYQSNDDARWVQYAMWTKDWFEGLVREYNAGGDPIEGKTLLATFSAIENGLRRQPGNIELRDAAIEFATIINRPTDAMSHLAVRIEQGRANNEDVSKYEFQLAGFNAKTGNDQAAVKALSAIIGLDLQKVSSGQSPFDVSAATNPELVEAYFTLYQILATRQRNPELAAAVINQMVDANPDLPLAHVMRARIFRSKGNIENAKADIDKALSLTAKTSDDQRPIIVEAAEVYMAAGDFKKARQQLSQYLQLDPNSAGPYRMLADWAIRQNDGAQAREFINQGLERKSNDIELLELSMSLELDSAAVPQSVAALEALRQVGLHPTLITYYEARLDILKGDTVKATRKLEDAASEIAQLRPHWAPRVDHVLATAYASLGQSDRALQRYKSLVEAAPNDLRMLWGVINAYRDLGQTSDAINTYMQLNKKLVNEEGKLPPNYPFLVSHLEMEVTRQQQRPQPEWQFADALAREIQASKLLSTGEKYAVLTKYFEQIGDTDRAEKIRQYVGENDPNNAQMRIGEITAIALTDVDSALEKLDAFEKDSGNEIIATRLLRIELLIKQNPPDYREQLVALEDGSDKFPSAQRVALYKALAAGYMHILETNEVGRLYGKAVQAAPQDTELRMQLLQLAIHGGNEENMRSSVAEIEEIFGSGSAVHSWARASCLIWRFKNGLEEEKALDDAYTLVQAGLAKREGWAQLRHLAAEINRLKGDSSAALAELERALKSGKAHAKDVLDYASLLAGANRLDEAKEQYESVGRNLWSENDKLTYMSTLSRLGQLPDEVEFDRESNNAFYHLNVGRILASDADFLGKMKNQTEEAKVLIPKRLDEAVECFRKTVELEPTLEEGWKYLIRTLVTLGKTDEADQAIREAQLEITEERTQLFLAHINEFTGKFNEAYAHYKSCLKTDPENIEAIFGVVNLLRNGGGKLTPEARQKEVQVYVDKMINMDSGSDNPTRMRIQAMARRMKAQDLVSSSTHQDYLAALELLEQNQVAGQPMAAEDLLMYATFSASRSDGESRARAIRKLEEVQVGQSRRLTNSELLVLAELYKKQNRWQECSSVMNDLLSKAPNDMTLLGPWLSWLLEDDQLQLAERWLDNANPQSLAAVRTRAHIWVKNGDTPRALKLLAQLMPKKIETPEQESLVVTLAGIMETMAVDDPQIHSSIEKIWRKYAQDVPEQSLMLAAYLGRRGDPKRIDEAMKICKTHVDNGRLPQTLPVALGILRTNQARIPIGSPHQNLVKTWFDEADQMAPDSPALAIQRSEFDGLVGDFAAVEKNLRRYIASTRITPQQKATAYNNLAYVLALQGKGQESMSLVKEAVNILGPISDLRDTRAMVYLALNKPTEALEDLNAAITHGGESPFKLFHKALAELESGDRENATDSMQKAIELGLEVNQLNLLEKRQFDTLVSKLSIEPTKPVSAVSP